MTSDELNRWMDYHFECIPTAEGAPWGKFWGALQRRKFTYERCREATDLMLEQPDLQPEKPRGVPAAVAKLATSHRITARLMARRSSDDIRAMESMRTLLMKQFPDRCEVFAGPRKIPGVVTGYQYAKAVVTFDVPIRRSEGKIQDTGHFVIEHLERR